MTLRFAPIVRVSTERAEKKGESLHTQTKQIKRYVESLDGTIPEYAWSKYCGQEHSTPEFERQKLDSLLADSAKDLFDAIIVCDVSRWARDNLKSKEGLNILRQNGIRFFAGTLEYDLFNPQHCFILGMSTESNEFFAAIQAEKSIKNRIERAKRNVPTSGNLPFGRTFDKKTAQWGLDHEKQRDIQWAAKKYIEGGNLREIAKTIGVDDSNLSVIFNHKCGPTWEVRYRKPELNIDETVIHQVPRLLDDETIAAIRKRAESNKTYTHSSKKKSPYLLSSVIFCARCGHALTGQTNNKTLRYYRHGRSRSEKCVKVVWPKADEIENAVLFSLFHLYRDLPSMERAIIDAIPNKEEIEQHNKDLVNFKKKLAEAEKEKRNIVKAIRKGLIEDDDAKRDMTEVKGQIANLKEEIERIGELLKDSPSKDMIKKRSKLIQKNLKDWFSSPSRLKKMSFEEMRSLVEIIFDGKAPDGSRLGVYCDWNTKGKVSFEIRGLLAEGFDKDIFKGRLPMNRRQALSQFGPDGIRVFDEIGADGIDDNGPYYNDITKQNERLLDIVGQSQQDSLLRCGTAFHH